MAHKAVAASWLLNKKDNLNVSFIEYSWGRPDYCDIAVQIEENGLIHNGRGTDRDGDIALEKASAEAIERWCCQRMNISTVGCAIHNVEAEAIKNSQEEFLERYIFNYFLEKGSSIREIDNAKLFYSLASDCDYKFRSWVMCIKDLGSLIVTISFLHQKPISIGMSSSPLGLAIEKSYIESLRNFRAFQDDPTQFLEKVTKNKDLWCCDPKFLKQVMLKIEQTNSCLEKSPQTYLTATETKSASEVLGVNDCPLFFCRTSLIEEING